jgi:hypothetical protein
VIPVDQDRPRRLPSLTAPLSAAIQ